MADIDRRSVLAAGAAALALAKSARAQDARPQQTARPRASKPRGSKLNILLVVNDQMRALADIPQGLPLPAHEWLQKRGISFSHYHVNTTPCGPSRAVMYTGLHTQNNGMYANPNTPPFPQITPDMQTLGKMLRAAGYRTPYKGKWHLSNINEGLQFRNVPDGKKPFDNTRDILEPFGFSHYNFNGEREGLTWEGFMNDGVTAAEAVNELQHLADGDGQPWFMAVNFVNPHDIMFFDATGKGEQTRARPNLLAPLMEAPGAPVYEKDWKFPLPKSFYADDLSTKPMAQRAIVAASWAFYGKMPRSDEASWLRFLNYYYNCVRDVDQHMKTLFDALEATGQLDNTIIIYTSDHGERAGAHGMQQKSGTIYKEDVGVPLIVVHPDLPGSRTTRALASSVDLVPTILSMAGVSASEIGSRYPKLVGHDLSPALQSTTDRTKRDEAGVLFDYAVTYGWTYPDVPAGVSETRPLAKPDLMLRRLHRGVHDGRYKFARYFAPAQHHIPERWEDLLAYNDLELYDTQKDPDEIVNLATEPAKHRKLIERLNAMTNALIKAEIGVDNGAEYSGPTEQYNTLQLT